MSSRFIVPSLMAFAAICIACANPGRQAQQSLPVKQVDLATLIDDNHKNPVATLDKYKDNQLEVSGFVQEVGTGFETFVHISPVERGGIFSPKIIVHVDSGLVSELKKYPIGSKITAHVVLDQRPDNNRLEGRLTQIVGAPASK